MTSTLQILSFLKNRCCLPSSVWEPEGQDAWLLGFAINSCHLRCVVVISQLGVCHGALRELTLRDAKSGNLQVVVASYDIFRLYKEDFYDINWKAAFFDEAHRLKSDK